MASLGVCVLQPLWDVRMRKVCLRDSCEELEVPEAVEGVCVNSAMGFGTEGCGREETPGMSLQGVCLGCGYMQRTILSCHCCSILFFGKTAALILLLM